MKTARKTARKQREALDRKLSKLVDIADFEPPRFGWLKAIRESLGMTSSQLARKLEIGQSSAIELEARELAKTTSLATLERAAQAVGCKLVYAFIPEKAQSLEALVERRAEEYVRKRIKPVSHSMSLENQRVEKKDERLQVKRLSKELVEKLDSHIWDED